SRLTAAQRLQIYHQGYFARLFHCLETQFPALQQALGEDLFRDFCKGYLFQHPSQSHTLADLGEKFPDYLAATRPDREAPPEERASWPDFMIELARLEYASFRVFDGPGVEQAPPIPAETPNAELFLAPSVKVFAFAYPVDWYYYAVRREENPEFPAPQQTLLAVTRKDYRLVMFNLQPLQFSVLAEMAKGQSLTEAVSALAQKMEGAEAEVEALRQGVEVWKSRWLQGCFFRHEKKEPRP
ncbi:MAG: DNA-binding domain-containing protein, partial [Bacteroidota bacterium]